MSKQLMIALLLLGLAVAVMVINRGSVSLNLLVTDINAVKSLAFFGFMAWGIVIGVLLK